MQTKPKGFFLCLQEANPTPSLRVAGDWPRAPFRSAGRAATHPDAPLPSARRALLTGPELGHNGSRGR